MCCEEAAGEDSDFLGFPGRWFFQYRLQKTCLRRYNSYIKERYLLRLVDKLRDPGKIDAQKDGGRVAFGLSQRLLHGELVFGISSIVDGVDSGASPCR
jgi:hypothetical protein